MTTEINWHSQVLNPRCLQRIEALAIRRFGEGGLAEEATEAVLANLSHNDWDMLKSFKGQAKPDTFLYTVINHCVEEFARSRFGRPRPPAWLKREGELWVTLWKQICLERQLVESVIERLSSQQLREPTLIRQIIKTIKARLPWCGKVQKEINLDQLTPSARHATKDEEDDDLPVYNPPDQALTQQQYDSILHHLSQLISHDQSSVAYSALQSLNDQIKLNDEERVALRMVYQDGLNKTVVAQAFGIPPQRLTRLINRALQRIATALQTLDIDWQTIREMVRDS